MIDDDEYHERVEFYKWYKEVTSYTEEDIWNLRKWARNSLKSRAIRLAQNAESNERLLAAMRRTAPTRID